MSGTIITRRISVFFVVHLVALVGCMAKQGYVTLQDWQSQECKTVVDDGERERCLEENNRTYDDYINSDAYKEGNVGRQ